MIEMPLARQPSKPYPPNTIHIYFSIDDDNNVTVYPNKQVYLLIGQSLLITRIGRGVSDRILYSDEGIIAVVNDRWIARMVGTTIISVIPSGYDWDNVVKIEVTVIE
jgi:hypothetical protein